MTFLFFIYDDIQWGTDWFQRWRWCEVSDGVRYYMAPGALKNQTLNIDEGSNVGVRGLYIYRVDLPACSVLGGLVGLTKHVGIFIYT